MRKKILLSATALTVMGAAGFAALTSNNQTRELSDLELANIEALTNNESKSTITANCDPVSIVVTTKCVVYCPSCYTAWTPENSPKGKTDVSSIKGCCTCGYCFDK